MTESETTKFSYTVTANHKGRTVEVTTLATSSQDAEDKYTAAHPNDTVTSVHLN